MNLEIFILDGYGQYVWSAFLFSFTICIYLYFQTKKELKKQEKIFLNEFKHLQTIKIETVKSREITKEALSSSSF